MCGLGDEAILSAGGGGVRPMDDMELPREAFLVSVGSLCSDMAATPVFCGVVWVCT